MNAPNYQQALGRKIAAERRRRGLSQPELARMIDRSVAWVSQVERGVRKVDRMSVLETLAAALDVPLAELAAEAPVVAAVTGEPPGAGGLRLVLSGAYALRAMLDGRRAPALSTLRTKTRKAWELTHAGRYTELSELLRGLVPDLETAARAVPEDQRAEVFELMAATYQACSAALAKLGEPEAAWIAADRAMAAAERAGNPMLVAAGAFRLVFVFINARHYDQAEETAWTAAEAPDDPGAVSRDLAMFTSFEPAAPAPGVNPVIITVGERSPALAAIKPLATIPSDNNIHITWNPGDLTWDGMFVANGAAKPLTVLGIEFNNNKGCELRPYRMTEVRKSIDLPQAIKVWGESAINLFGLPKLEPDEVMVPDLSNGFPSPAMRPDRLTLKPGARIPIYNGTKCDTVTEASVETDKGTVPIRFKAPYTGH